MPGDREHRTVRLRDGRVVAYAHYGAPDGAVVVNAHGGLACRLDIAAADGPARAAGVRVISPDRPGIGGSDPSPGRTILDWAADLGELMDHLEAETFSVMGWSMGGQYAAAAAAAMPTRVRRLAIIAGALPLTEPGVFAQLPAFDRMYTRLSQAAPWLDRMCFRTMHFAASRAPHLYGRLAAAGLGPVDGQVLRDEGYAVFAAMSAEAFRQPEGVVEDYRAWARPWGFGPEQITVATDVWAGENDQLVKVGWESELARRIPGATLHVRPGGHFLAHLHYPEIFERLTG